MSSLFTVAERELARLAWRGRRERRLDVIVDGLGLGYTAQEALKCKRIRTLTVIEYSDAVIDWHERELLPDTAGLAADGRVALVCADFFAAATTWWDRSGRPGRTYDAILLDIDHSPRHLLHDPHADFYTHEGLRAASARLVPGGTFAMWSDDAAGRATSGRSSKPCSPASRPRGLVRQPLTRGQSAATIYLATRPG